MKENLRDHQHVMYQMLKEVDRICRKNHITYMLFAGTMLGAVRHKGFIPWDDDLDILMLRSEYDRFLKIAEKDLNLEKYYLQKEFTPHWSMFFSKLRCNGTACIERYVPKDEDTHMGVYIDIFPCDNLYENRIIRKLQFAASKIVIANSLEKRGYLTNSKLKKAVIFISRIMPTNILKDFVEYKKGTKSSMVHTFFGGASKYDKNIYPRNWFSKTKTCQFEDAQFPIPVGYDEILTQLYGDYMIPLAKEKRGLKKHAEIVDLHNSYTVYKGIQKKIHFGEYTRSIR